MPYATIESLAGTYHPHAIEIQDFSSYALTIDVRPWADYEEDHVPGAVQLSPPASDAESSVLGAQGSLRSGALVAQEDRVSDELPPALAALVAPVKFDQAILLYCGRGGRDSQPLAKALRWRGWTVDVLPGGWINYRRWVQAGLEVLPRLVMFRVIACSLGSEAARVLDVLRAAGHQVLDVEGLAGWRHGALVQGEQPSQAWFESQLLQGIRDIDPRRPVWIADVEQQLGSLVLPPAMLDAVGIAPMAWLKVDLPERVRAWREDEPLLKGDGVALVDALASRTSAPGAEVIARWRSLAAAGAKDELLSSVLRDGIDDPYGEQAALRSVRRHGLPDLCVTSLEPEDLVSAVRAWAKSLSAPG